MADKWLKVIITVIFAAFAPWTIIMQIPYPHTEYKNDHNSLCWTFLTSFGLFMRHLQAPRPKRGSFKFKYVWAEPILLYIYIIQAILTQYDAQIWQQMRWRIGILQNKKGLKITLFSLHLKIKQGLYCQHPRDFYYTAENVNTPTRRLRYSGPMNEQDECVACFWLADFIFGSIRQARICPMVVKIVECRWSNCVGV